MADFVENWRNALTRTFDKSGVTKRGGALQPAARKVDIATEMVDELYEPYKGGPTKSELVNRLVNDSDAFTKLAEFHHDLGMGTRYDKDPNFDTEALARRRTIPTLGQFGGMALGVDNALARSNGLFSRRLNDGSEYRYRQENILLSPQEKRAKATALIKDMWK